VALPHVFVLEALELDIGLEPLITKSFLLREHFIVQRLARHF
jgi:hypothetical protein